MKKTFYILTLVMFLVIVNTPIVIADSSELEIDRVKITIDGRQVISTSSDSGSIDVDPDDELRIEIRLKNTFDDDTDMRIEDIKVMASIEYIDDDGDIYDRSDKIYVRADGTRTVRLELNIPADASSVQDYDLEIVAQGYDENGVMHEDAVEIEIDVKRDEHKIVFNRLWINDVACDGNAAVRIELENIGEDYEEDVEIFVNSNDLGTLFWDRFDLPSTDYDDVNTYNKQKQLDLSELTPGMHSITVKLVYDSGDEMLQKKIDFSVYDCRTVQEIELDREEMVERTIEQYSNPDRDTSFLFGGEDRIEVMLPPPVVSYAPKVPTPPCKYSGFSTFVLFIANIAVIAFILLLFRSWYFSKD